MKRIGYIYARVLDIDNIKVAIMRSSLVKIGNKKIMTRQDACAIVSYWGWIKRCDSFNFYNKYVKSKVNILFAKGIISKYARQSLC